VPFKESVGRKKDAARNRATLKDLESGGISGENTRVAIIIVKGKSRFSDDDARGARMQGVVNRGGRYRLTNSATPETYPFIVGHRVRGRTREIKQDPPFPAISIIPR